MPFRISRRLWMGGRPPGLAAGTSGFRCSHSGSVRSVSYGLRQVIGAHQHTGKTLFKRPLKPEAIRELQRLLELEETGIADASLNSALRERHGSSKCRKRF